MSRQKIIDEEHPRYGEIGTFDKTWVIPNSKPDLHCHTITFEDGKTEQFLSYQIESVKEYELPNHDETMSSLDKLTIRKTKS